MANFTSDELESYLVTVSDVSLSNLTIKTAEINIVNVTDDFSTLQKLIDNANGTLTLDKNYTFNPLTDVDFDEGIMMINNDITIDGAGFTIDAIGQAAIFNVLSGNATLGNITFINAKSSFNGGAIYWNDNSTGLYLQIVILLIIPPYYGGGAIFFGKI